VVLIHRFDVLGVDLHCHKFSSPNSSYFSRNRRFFFPISAQIDELLEQDFSKKFEPALDRLKPAHIPAKAGPLFCIGKVNAIFRPDPPRFDLLHCTSPQHRPARPAPCAETAPPGTSHHRCSTPATSHRVASPASPPSHACHPPARPQLAHRPP
jgi:hypothetical protein